MVLCAFRAWLQHSPSQTGRPICSGQTRIMAFITYLQDVHFLWRPFLRDPDDDMVLECAVASACQYIITHNVKDFRRARELNVSAITPAEFLTLLRSKP